MERHSYFFVSILLLLVLNTEQWNCSETHNEYIRAFQFDVFPYTKKTKMKIFVVIFSAVFVVTLLPIWNSNQFDFVSTHYDIQFETPFFTSSCARNQSKQNVWKLCTKFDKCTSSFCWHTNRYIEARNEKIRSHKKWGKKNKRKISFYIKIFKC